MDPRQGYKQGNQNYQHGDNYHGQQAPQKTNAPQPVQKREIQISQTTKEKAEAAKAYIESNPIPLITPEASNT